MEPSVFNYMEIRHFLQDIYQYRKKVDKSFSYTTWAQKLGFSNKTLLRLLVQGKRKISINSRNKLSEYLGLDGLRGEYFDALIDYSQAQSSSQKQALGARLLQLQRRTFAQPEVSIEHSSLRDVYGPMLLTLISSAETPMTAKFLRDTVEIPEERLVALLDSLMSDRLIVQKESGYIATQSTYKIPDSPGHQALRNYYQHWIQKSVEAINLPFSERRFRSLQILLSKSEFEDLNQSFQEFVLSNLSRFQHNSTSERRLYLLNSALFPVTKDL